MSRYADLPRAHPPRLATNGTKKNDIIPFNSLGPPSPKQPDSLTSASFICAAYLTYPSMIIDQASKSKINTTDGKRNKNKVKDKKKQQQQQQQKNAAGR
ncbi:hypothetical protein EAE99_006798 [Botrytis elliptica]|nr:hypothetical protein EAE99_006798 [Botrytis elliptica]